MPNDKLAGIEKTRVHEDDLAPILEHFARAAAHSQETFLELCMVMPHIKRLMPEFEDSFGALLTGAYQNWQTLEEAGDECLGSQILDYVPTGKPLPALPSGN